MTNKAKHTILLVDDEPAILKSLTRLLRKQDFEIFTALSGDKAIKLLEEYKKPVSLIISDQRMPVMNGTEFLEKAKRLYPDAIRILLTGYADMDAIIDSVNKGEIYRYITKPWDDEDLILQIRQGLELYSLVEENKRLFALTQEQNKKLFEFGRQMDQKVKERSQKMVESNKTMAFLNRELETTLLNTVRAFAALTEMQTPSLKGHGKRVSRLSCWIAEKLNLSETEITQIEIAAILHDIGKAGFSEKMQRFINTPGGSDDEKKLYKQHPEKGQEITAFISRFDDVGIMVRHHHERYDGKGFPDMLSADEIPIGSRIIAVADTYDRITHIDNNNRYLKKYLTSIEFTPDHMSDKDKITNAAVEYIRKNSFSLFDPGVVKVFMETVEEMLGKIYREKKIPLSDITAGMVLERGLYTFNGRFLIPHKTELTDSIIAKLKILHENNEIDDYLFII